MTHSPALPTDVLYRFVGFIADPVLGRLHWEQVEVPLTHKTFHVLVVLLKQHGALVSKEEIFTRVWPDTVVEENNLARCVSMLRKAFRAHAADIDFISTVPGRGYSFVAPIEHLCRADLVVATPPHIPQEPPVPMQLQETDAAGAATGASSARWRRLLLLSAAAALVALAGITWMRSVVAARSQRPDGVRLWQATSMAKLEGQPSWSPDGQFLAYSSTRSGTSNLWVQAVSGGQPIQITSSMVGDSQPAWSPDGRSIVFRSERNGGGLFLVPAFGGAATRLTEFGHRPMWSPDGTRILFYYSPRPLANRAFVTTSEGAPPQEVLSSILKDFTRFRIAWHPDGQRISVLGRDTESGTRFTTVSISHGAAVESRFSPDVARRLSETSIEFGQFIWSAGGDAVFLEGRVQQARNVWRVGVDPKTLKWIDGPTRLTTSSTIEGDLALAPDGKRLAFSSRTERTRGWSFPLDPNGRISAVGDPITPDGSDASVLDISNDGKHLAYRTSRNGHEELWTRSLADGAERLASVEEGAAIGTLRWSGDAQQIAYSRPAARGRPGDVILVNVADEGQRRLNVGQAVGVYDWMPDLRSLLVSCGPGALCRLNVGAAAPRNLERIAFDPARQLFQARTSPDGRWISFVAATDARRSTVYLTPPFGSEWIQVNSGQSYDDKPRWSADGGILYYLSDRSGSVNVWARRINVGLGRPEGDEFQVTHFDTPDRTIPTEMRPLQVAVTRDRLILPIRESAGAIWVLEYGQQ